MKSTGGAGGFLFVFHIYPNETRGRGEEREGKGGTKGGQERGIRADLEKSKKKVKKGVDKGRGIWYDKQALEKRALKKGVTKAQKEP